MWGGGAGGKLYWGGGGGEVEEPANEGEGIVVLFAWTSSKNIHLKAFVDLYATIGWRPLVCHADFYSLFFPDKATSLAFGVLDELMKELKFGPKPIVFVAFSGGAKCCMYKVLQDDYQLIRECICGQIYDSGPVDLTSDYGARFILGPRFQKLSHSQGIMSWMARAVASGLDALSLNRFELEHAEYWQTLYSSVSIGPFLIICSEDDELVPFPIIRNFVERLRELGGDVTLVNWISSQHLCHYKQQDAEYKIAISKLLDKAAALFLRRMRQTNEGQNVLEGSSGYICNGKAAVLSNGNLRRLRLEPDDDPFLPRSLEYSDAKEGEQKMSSFQVPNPPTISRHGVLSEILFDVCVPKNIEEWDIKPSPNGRQRFGFSRGYGSLNPIRRMRRSRL